MSTSSWRNGDVEEGPPTREAGATLDAPDQAEMLINRESIRAAYDAQNGK